MRRSSPPSFPSASGPLVAHHSCGSVLQDYLGIAWLIAASVNAFVYFAFYCQPTALLFYTALNLGVAVGVHPLAVGPSSVLMASGLPADRWVHATIHELVQ